jgi:hypothetical protein
VPAPFIFSSMHLLTTSARLSRSSRLLPFSVRIQHSRAARDRVMGSALRTGSGGLVACVVTMGTSGLLAVGSALGASAAVGPVPSVSQEATASVHEMSKAKRVIAMILPAFKLREFIRRIPDIELKVTQRWPGPGYLPEMTNIRNARDGFHNRVHGHELVPIRGRLFSESKGNHSLEALMRIFWVAAAAFVLVSGGARAEAQPGNGDAAIGIGVICNTSQQAEQFVRLRSAGTQAEQAMRAVNASARDNGACGIAAIAYIRDQTVDTMKLRDRLVQIVRINVVAGFNGAGWQRISDMVQFAVLEGGGESI